VRLPGSKSISNRVLLLAALARGETLIDGLLEADDTRVMREALMALAVPVAIGVGNFGLAAALAGFPCAKPISFWATPEPPSGRSRPRSRSAAGTNVLDGVPRMRERPIADLVDALNALGARIVYRGQPGYPPLQIAAAHRVEC